MSHDGHLRPSLVLKGGVGVRVIRESHHVPVDPVRIGPVTLDRNRAESELVYQATGDAGALTVELVRAVRCLAVKGRESVVLDATWRDGRQREAALVIASVTASELVELRCDAPLDVREQRVGRRARLGSDASDATVQIARELAGRADPWPAATVIDTAGGIDKALAAGLLATGGR